MLYFVASYVDFFFFFLISWGNFNTVWTQNGDIVREIMTTRKGLETQWCVGVVCFICIGTYFFIVKHSKHILKCIAGYLNLCKYFRNLNIITFKTTICVVLYWGHRCPMGGRNGSAFLFASAVLFPPPYLKPTQSPFLKFIMWLTQMAFVWKEWVNSLRRI